MSFGLIINTIGYSEKKPEIVNQLNSPQFKERLEKVCSENPHYYFIPDQPQQYVKKLGESAIRYEPGNKPRKGFAVLQAIEQMKEDNIDKIVYIDGSTKISMISALDIAEKLLNDDVEVVFSQRRGDKGITKTRWLVEKLELFLVSSTLRKEMLPDGQCGCWGFKVNSAIGKDIRLEDVDGYEVELALVIETLHHGLKYCFVPVNVQSIKKSCFKVSDNIKKIKFLRNRIEIPEWILLAALKEFKEKNLAEIEEANKELESEEPSFEDYYAALKTEFSK